MKRSVSRSPAEALPVGVGGRECCAPACKATERSHAAPKQLFAKPGRTPLLAQIKPYLSLVELHQAVVLAETHQRVEKAYFPQSGIISCVVELKGGDAIGTGMIGNDGEFGAGHALDAKVSLNRVVIHVAGIASVIGSERLRELADELPAFKRLLVSYEQFFLSQVHQTAACNAVHNVQARTCKWLLRMHDLVGIDLPLTQEFLAQMMGVRRTAVTEVAGELQKAGMITYSRGRVHIVNLEQIRQLACECDEDVRSHYQRLFGSNKEARPAFAA
jgi:CRP-like cAMP-binding protein